MRTLNVVAVVVEAGCMVEVMVIVGSTNEKFVTIIPFHGRTEGLGCGRQGAAGSTIMKGYKRHIQSARKMLLQEDISRCLYWAVFFRL